MDPTDETINPADGADSSSPPGGVALAASMLIFAGLLDIAGALAVNIGSLLHTGRGVNCGGAAAAGALAGISILRRSALARGLILFSCWISFLWFPVLLVLSFLRPETVSLAFAGFHTTVVESPVISRSMFVLSAALSIFLFRVLTRPHVVTWFNRVTSSGSQR